MQTLWAPWRMEFLEGEKPTECVFCVAPKQNSKAWLVVHKQSTAFVILNKYPYNNGHLMIVPNRHVANLEDLPEKEWDDLMRLTRKTSDIVKTCYRPDGLNIGMNVGTAAGAGIKDHVHVHIVPRWNGDTNFMPVLAETKAMPEHLQKSFEKLHPYFEDLGNI